ncbi:Fungalysin metallopeptidase-domain-containing protein [Lactarius akahatsu]|uniref:Extracellular metalloproteinase n=1 Tax=Lactarius akahatsu TaxID=416441 RepID=A0AAD4LGD4_9AGAM|nr:Fungalysin metallopeptidase-domain-containing protein [Lactarius akahatsu]
MVSFAKLLAPALFAFLSVRTASATPWPSTFHHNTHRTHYLGADRSLKLEAFHPESIFEASIYFFRFGVEGVDPLPTYRRHPRDILNLGDIALPFLESKLGISKDNILLRAIVQGEAAQYAFLAQKINGIPIANAVASITLNGNGKISSLSSSFVKPSGSADVNPSISVDDATATAEKALKGTYNGHKTTLEFVVQPSGYAALSHVIQIQNDTAGTWYEAFIDAHDNTLLSVTDFVARASYRVLPIHELDPTQGFQTIIDPQDMTASPNGWHQEFSTTTNLTAGNNAIAYKGSQLINVAVQTSDVLNFIYDVDLTKDPSSGTNVQAATTNAFYVVNTFHDFTYKYGFTETTFNFQTNNFNKGGEGFDRILVSVQDDYGINDAVFFTPPDGQSGKMQLYLYVKFSPRLDSALQNDLVIHECQHGASNRMTGGGTARCFQTSESAGVAEGYADAMADWFSQGGTTADFVFGRDASKSSTGLRKYAYSTSNVTNPLRYSSLKGMTDAHDMGSVWANTLHNVYAALVIAKGWSTNALTDPTTNEGNVVWLHLFIDALLLQPCNPTFLNARDAWIQADANRYGGAHTCLLWVTFASRGFGVNATDLVDDVSFPPDCDC